MAFKLHVNNYPYLLLILSTESCDLKGIKPLMCYFRKHTYKTVKLHCPNLSITRL